MYQQRARCKHNHVCVVILCCLNPYKCTSYKCTSYKCTSYKCTSYKCTSYKCTSYKCTSYKCTSYKCNSYKCCLNPYKAAIQPVRLISFSENSA